MTPVKQLRPSIRHKHPELPYGVYWRDRALPYLVKFWDPALKRSKYLGSFCILDEAIAVADAYLKEHRR